MAIENLLSPWSLFLGALILVVVAIIVLTVIERRLNKKVLLKKEEAETHFQRQIEGVRAQRDDSKKFLNAIDGLARNFFESRFEMNKSMRYSDFIKEFRKNGNDRAAKFCIRMQETLYAGEEVNDVKLNSLMRDLEMFIMDEENKEKEEKIMQGNYWQQEINLGNTKTTEKQDMQIKSPKEIDGGNEKEEIEIEKLRKQVKADDEDMDKLENAQKERKKKLERETEMIKKESEIDISELEQTPLEIDEIKTKKVKKGKKGHRSMERISSIDDFDRIKDRIKERKQSWAIQGVGID